MDKKVIAIYARKSKATDKGESLKVQIEKCKQLALYKYSDYELDFIVYEEQEGKTGANLKREKFKELITDIKSGKKHINILMVYKLDRLTRSVQDFSETYEVLNTYDTEFISVKEDFDTTTPMGRAMLTITVVFAQLEREVIAERIQDAMIELAKTGRWLGGMTPYAYDSLLTTYINDAGQEKRKNHLEIISHEALILQKIYSVYLELGSLSKVETYLLDNNYKTRNDIDFSRYGIRFILTNPVYCQADDKVYEYFAKNDYQICAPKEAFDGKHGVMAYNKTQSLKNIDTGMERKETRWRKNEEWIIAVGEHKPLVTSEDWIKVQKMIRTNIEKSYRASRTTDALLSGLLRCDCGNLMRPKTSGNYTNNGEKAFYYLCEMKERSKGSRCNMANVPGNILDRIVVNKIFKLKDEIKPIYKDELISNVKMNGNEKLFHISKKDYIISQIMKTRQSLSNTNQAILRATSEEAVKIFVEQYQNILNKLNSLEAELECKVEEETNELQSEELILKLSDFNENLWSILSYEQKKYIVRALIDTITWNGKEITVFYKGAFLPPMKMMSK